MSETPAVSPVRSAVLWGVAVVLMLGSAAFQRLTGPTISIRGAFTLAGVTYRYRLPRKGITTAPVEVTIPDPVSAVSGHVVVRRYPTDDPFRRVPLRRTTDGLAATLPPEPAAGKLEYAVVLEGPAGMVRLPDPAGGQPTAIVRYKDPVPVWLLAPHVALMFCAVLFGTRAGLAAAFTPAQMRSLLWITLGAMTVGGLVLGPLAQEAAFGEYWTGFPFGYDLTDNKTLLMWGVWAVAAVVFLRAGVGQGARRIAVGLAALIMLAVYLVPHSLRGSELEYDQLSPPAKPSLSDSPDE